MMRFKRSILIFLILGTLGCGSAPPRQNLSYGDQAKEAYYAAMEDFHDEDCMDAEEQFQTIRRKYTYSRYAALSELRLADCKFIDEKYIEAISAYRDFLRARPSHNDVPYAEFKIAESYFRQIPEGWLFSPAAYERDQGSTRRALEQLRHYIMNYPRHKRIEEAKKMSQKALALLAKHELSVADFYLSRDKPKAAIGRLEVVLNAYQGSGVEAKALFLLAKTLLSLRAKDKAKKAFNDLMDRYPKSDYALQAKSYLREIN